MHEYHEAIHIIDHAIAEAEANGAKKVSKIHLVIGEDSGYSGETIRMHFEDAAKGTCCEGAEICVRQTKIMLLCPKCHEKFVRRPFHDECPHCGVPGEPTDAGREMAIEDIEFAEE